ncbi:XVIPCD domain-containing protein, partial [Stenotrophomonas sp.]|uniref:XVIPCD domain-containing protein n=1 Tax=Stenotrophomonas sp. TaxID=69392 RepID=UPI0031F2E2AA
ADTPTDDQDLERSGFALHETRPVRLSSNDLPAAKPAPQTAGSDHTPLEGGVWAPTQQDAERNQAWPSKPDHPDYPLFQQIRGGVAAVDAEYGRTFDATSERMSASLFVLAKGNGLTRADHVVMSSATATSPEAEFVFLVEGDIGDPAGRRASMRTRQALEMPVEEAMQQLEAQNQEQQQLQAQQMEQQAQGQQAQLEANARVMTLDGDGGGGGGE